MLVSRQPPGAAVKVLVPRILFVFFSVLRASFYLEVKHEVLELLPEPCGDGGRPTAGAPPRGEPPLRGVCAVEGLEADTDVARNAATAMAAGDNCI